MSAKRTAGGSDDVEEEYISYSTPVGKLLLQLNTICKKPTLDCKFSEILDKLLKKLNEADKYIENGIYFSNFPEAALFLQTSSVLYSKKVDLLWDSLIDYQKRNLLYIRDVEKQDELQKIEERSNKYKRKKKTLELRTQTDPFYDIFEDNIDVKKKINVYDLPIEPDKDLIKKWKDVNARINFIKPERKYPFERSQPYFKVVVNRDFQPDISFTDEEDDEFSVQYKHIYTHNLLKLLIEYNNNNLLPDKEKVIALYRLECQIVYDFLLEKRIAPGTPREKYDDQLRLYAAKYLIPQQNNADVTQEQANFAETVVDIEPLPQDVVNDKLRRISLLETVKDDHQQEKSNCCQNGHVNSIMCGDLCVPLLSTEILLSKESDVNQDSGIFEKDDFECSIEDDNRLSDQTVDEECLKDTEEGAVKDTEEGAGKDTEEGAVKDTEEDTVKNCSSTDCNSVRKSERISNRKVAMKSCITKFDWCCGGSLIEIPNDKIDCESKALECSKKSNDDCECPIKRRKLSQKAIEKLLQGVSVKMMKWEKFHSMNYNSQDGEGDMVPVNYDCSESEDELDNIEDDHMNIVPAETAVLEVAADEEHSAFDDSCTNVLVNDSGIDLSGDDVLEQEAEQSDGGFELDNSNTEISSVIDGEVPSCSNAAKTSVVQDEINKSRQNVTEWKAKIVPILRELNSGEFDIHEYGSKIMDTMAVNNTKLFSDIVDGKSSAEVVRYFISSLQLANTYNIDISGGQPGRLSNDTMSLTLLQTERYHEHLQDFHAPSEETFRDSMARVRAMNVAGPSVSKKLKTFHTSST